MDKSLHGFLHKKIRIANRFECHVVDILFFIFVTILSMLIRYAVRNTVSMDYVYALEGWYSDVKRLGGIASLQYNIGNYSPLYMLLFTLFSYLPLEGLGMIKVLTLVFDYITALMLFYYVLRHTQSFTKATLAYGLLLFLPSVLFNGAVWAQCDIIYTLFLVISVERIMHGHPVMGCIAFGISFSFKLQSMFLFPVLLVLWMKQKVKIRQFFLIPVVYLISILPSVIAGRNFIDILLIYFEQVGTYQTSLTFNMPNIYQLIGNHYLDFFGKAGMIFSVAILGAIFYYLYLARFQLTMQFVLTLSVFIALLVPYFLPYMHERYAFPADIFALLLFFYSKKHYWVVIVTQLISLFAYQQFLFQVTIIPYPLAALFYLLILIILGKDLYNQIRSNPLPGSPEVQSALSTEGTD